MNPLSSSGNPSAPRRICPGCGFPLDDGGGCVPCLIRNAVDDLAPDPDPNRLEFDDYIVFEKIGEGGMGAVHRARKKSLNKEVAIKFIKSGQSASQVEILLFKREAELASKLDHPNIVDVFHIGEHDGKHYLVLRLVDGLPLDKSLAQAHTPLPLSDRIRLVRTVARAVHHAHQRGIIHRDLKPGNILIDEHGQPHVTDFGLARWSQGDSILPQGGHPIGTPAYMAPEQIQSDQGPVTVRSDVWSLGVILFSLVAHRPPFHAESYPILYKAILETPAPPLLPPGNAPPSTATTELLQLSHSALRDLESICSHALEKRPFDRYSSAAELADDLDRWLERRPVVARPLNVFEKTTRWCRRHPALTGLAAAVLVAVVAVAQSISSYLEAKREAFAAKTQALAARREEILRKNFHYVSSLATAHRAFRSLDFTEFHHSLDESRPHDSTNADLRSIDWSFIKSQGDALRSLEFFNAQEQLVHIARAPRSNHWAVLGVSNIWLLSSNASVIHKWKNPTPRPSGRIQFSPNNEWLAAATSTNTILIRLADFALKTISTNTGNVLEFSPDSARFAVSSSFLSADDSTPGLTIYDAATGQPVWENPDVDFPAIRWSTPDASLQVVDRRGNVMTVDISSPTIIANFEGGYQNADAHFTWDGTYLFRSSAYGIVRAVDVRNGELMFTIPKLPVRDLEFASFPGIPILAAVSLENAVQIVHFQRRIDTPLPNETTHEIVSSLKFTPGHSSKITGLSFGANTNEVFSCSLDGRVFRTPVRPSTNSASFVVEHSLLTAAGARPAFSPDGQWAALLIESSAYGITPDRSVLVHIPTRRRGGIILGQVSAWSDSNLLFASTLKGDMSVWDVSDPFAPAPVSAFSPAKNYHFDARREAILADAGRWIIYPAADEKPYVEAFHVASGATVRAVGKEIDLYAASPIHPFVILASKSRPLERWDLESNEITPLTPRRTARASSSSEFRAADIRFSQAGNRFAVSTYTYDIFLFDGHTCRSVPSIEGRLSAVTTLDFSHEERTLIGGDNRFSFNCWNLATLSETYRETFPSPVYWVAASPAGAAVITGHAPEKVGAARGSLGKGSWRIWPLEPITPVSSSPQKTKPHPESIWMQHRALAQKYPTPPPAK